MRACTLFEEEACEFGRRNHISLQQAVENPGGELLISPLFECEEVNRVTEAMGDERVYLALRQQQGQIPAAAV